MSRGPWPLTWFDTALINPGRSWRGRLEQVFRHAAVARVDNLGPLVTLLHPSRALVPLGVQLPLESCGLQAGDAFTLTGTELRVGRLDFTLSGDGVVLRLATASGGTRAALQQHLRDLELPPRTAALLAADGHPVALDAVLTAQAGSALRQLAAALGQGRGADVARPAQRLVGLGPGSTPTGDDLLVGAAAAAQRFSGLGWLAADTVDALGAVLRDVRGGATTDVAREMLGHAAAGQFPEALLDVVHALGAEDSDGRLRRAVLVLDHVGAQTGYDWLAGVLAVAHALGPTSQGEYA